MNLTRVDPEIQKALDHFLKLIHEDIYKILGEGFAMQILFNIGIPKEREQELGLKLQEAKMVVQHMLDNTPKFQPPNVGSIK